MTEIPNWWCKICLESVQELWLVDVVCEWQTKYKRVQSSKLCKPDESTTKWNLWNLFFFRLDEFEFCWSSFVEECKSFNIINQEKPKIKYIYLWNPTTTGLILVLRNYYVNVDFRHHMEFLSLRTFFLWNVPSSEEQEEMTEFASFLALFLWHNWYFGTLGTYLWA